MTSKVKVRIVGITLLACTVGANRPSSSAETAEGGNAATTLPLQNVHQGPPLGLTGKELRQWFHDKRLRERERQDELRRQRDEREREQQRRLDEHIRSQKHASKVEILQMLKEMPRGFISCGTGIRWLGFLHYAPHSPYTVAALREIYTESKDVWVQRQVLHALSLQTDVGLRGFWRSLYRNPKTPLEWEPSIVGGLMRTGAPEDQVSLLKRLGKPRSLPYLVDWGKLKPAEVQRQLIAQDRPREFDRALLQAIRERPIPVAYPFLKELFLNRQADTGLRSNAFRLLLDAPSTEKEALLREGIEDPDTGIRVAAASRLFELLGTDKASLRVNLLNDPEPSVRIVAIANSRMMTKHEDLPFLFGLLKDSHPGIRTAAAQAINYLLIEDLPLDDLKSNFEVLMRMGREKEPVLWVHITSLLHLAKKAEEGGDLEWAEEIYRKARSVSLRMDLKEHPNLGRAEYAYELARFLFHTGRREEALRLRDAMTGGHVNTLYVEELMKAMAAPLYLTVERVNSQLSPGEPVKLRFIVTNVSGEEQTLLLNRLTNGSWSRVGQPYGKLEFRPPFEEGSPGQRELMELTLKPGERLESVNAGNVFEGSPHSSGRLKFEGAISGFEVVSRSGERWESRMRAFTSVQRQ